MPPVGSELARVELLRALFAPRAADARVLFGIGDDAAVLAAPDEPLVWTIDAAVEGVHFLRALLPLVDIGYRATVAAASDLAAMGARPLRRVIQQKIEDRLSDALLAKEFLDGDTIQIDVNDEKEFTLKREDPLPEQALGM